MLPARGSLYAALLITAFANGLANRVQTALGAGLADAAAHLFGINAVLWFAFYVIARLGLDAPPERARGLDLLFAVPVLIAAMLPLPLAGTMAGVTTALLLLLTSAPATPLRRLALVGLAMSGPLFWGPICMRLFSPEVVKLESALIAGLTGLPTVDNMFTGADGTTFVVMNACSSLLNVSLAFVLLVALTQRFGIPLTRRLLPTALLAVAATIAVNIVRLATIGFFPQHFHYIHEGAGSLMFGMASLLAMGSVVLAGVVRAAQPEV